MKRLSYSIISLILILSLLCTGAFAVPTAVNVSDSEYGNDFFSFSLAETVVEQDTLTLDTVLPAEAFSSGSGTQSDPYIIKTAGQLALLSKVINEKTEGFADAYYELGANINLGAKVFTPIGISGETPFSGHFDGNGYNISNFVLTENKYTGLFGYIYNGSVKRLGISDFNITVSPSSNIDNDFSCIGVLAGYIYAENGRIDISQIGISSGIMDISANIYDVFAGNIAGFAKAASGGYITISDCYAENDISSENSRGVGYGHVGGLTGRLETVSQSFAQIVNSYCRASVSSVSNYASRAGGLVGYLLSSGSAYPDSASLLAEDTDVMLRDSFTVTNVYSLSKKRTPWAGSVTGNINIHASVKNAFYPDDDSISVVSDRISTSLMNKYCTEGTSVSVENFKSAEFLKLYGFDFENTWAISEDKNDSYPYLQCIRDNTLYKPVFARSMQAYLNLESEVTMSVGYVFEDMQSINPEDYTDKVGLLIWNAASAPEEENATYDNCDNIIEGAVYNSALSRFETTTGGIAAKNLGDTLTFRPYCLNDDGTITYGRIISEYSPKRYCYNQIEKNSDNENHTNLMVAILNYGAQAQLYFEYNMDNLMNSELSEELKTVAWDASLVRSDYSVPNAKDASFVMDSSVTSRGGYLNLEGAIDYNFYAALDFTPESAEIFYWTEADTEQLSELTLLNASSSEKMTWNAAKSRFEGKYEGQAPKEMFATVFALMVFEKDDGTKITSGVIGYSPERYAFINHNKTNGNAPLSRALAVYGDAARTYFKNK